MEVEHEEGVFVFFNDIDDVTDFRLVASGVSSELALSGLGTFN